MKLLFGSDELVAAWVACRIPHLFAGFKDMKTIGIINQKYDIVGGVVFHEYRCNDIQMSCAASDKKWLSKHVLRSLFSYPFFQLKCDRVTAFVPKKNIDTRNFVEKIGFVEEGNLRRGFVIDDCIAYGMLREECRWIKE